MAEPRPLPAPPPGMDARVDHEGVTWRFGRRVDVAVVAAGVGLAMALVPVGVGRGGLLVLPLALACLAVVIASLRRTTLRISSRSLDLHTKTLLGTDRAQIRIDDVTDARCARSDRGDLALVVRTAQQTVVVGAHQPEEALGWALLAVEHARRASAGREAAEGREWSFQRYAPDEVTRLREDPERDPR
ncbi:MAG: hypothetical protein R3F59_05425 [Myxococcota bacterium]